METPAIKSNFIPQAGKNVAASPRFVESGAFFALSWILLFLAACVWGGFLLYGYLIERDKATLLSELQTIIQTEDISTEVIDELAALDDQLKIADLVLSKHADLSLLLTFLEQTTLTNSLRFQSFAMQPDPNSGLMQVSLTGRARSFAALAYQVGIFEKEEKESVSNVSFSSLATEEETGDVIFNLSFLIKPDLVSFQRNLGIENKNEGNS